MPCKRKLKKANKCTFYTVCLLVATENEFELETLNSRESSYFFCWKMRVYFVLIPWNTIKPKYAILSLSRTRAQAMMESRFTVSYHLATKIQIQMQLLNIHLDRTDKNGAVRLPCACITCWCLLNNRNCCTFLNLEPKKCWAAEKNSTKT